MYELKKNGKVFTSKFVGTGPSSYIYKKKNWRAAVSQSLRNTALNRVCMHNNESTEVVTVFISKNGVLRLSVS